MPLRSGSSRASNTLAASLRPPMSAGHQPGRLRRLHSRTKSCKHGLSQFISGRSASFQSLQLVVEVRFVGASAKWGLVWPAPCADQRCACHVRQAPLCAFYPRANAPQTLKTVCHEARLLFTGCCWRCAGGSRSAFELGSVILGGCSTLAGRAHLASGCDWAVSQAYGSQSCGGMTSAPLADRVSPQSGQRVHHCSFARAAPAWLAPLTVALGSLTVVSQCRASSAIPRWRSARSGRR